MATTAFNIRAMPLERPGIDDEGGGLMLSMRLVKLEHFNLARKSPSRNYCLKKQCNFKKFGSGPITPCAEQDSAKIYQEFVGSSDLIK